MNCSLPGSSFHGIFQAIVLEWIAISFSRGSSQLRDWTQVSHIVDRHFTIWATREVLLSSSNSGPVLCLVSFNPRPSSLRVMPSWQLTSHKAISQKPNNIWLLWFVRNREEFLSPHGVLKNAHYTLLHIEHYSLGKLKWNHIKNLLWLLWEGESNYKGKKCKDKI